MLKYFKQQLQSVVQNHSSLSAYFNYEQIEQMFLVGRSMGFKSHVVCVNSASSTVYQEAEHETFDDFVLEISIKDLGKDLYYVQVKYWDTGYLDYINRVHELQMLDDDTY